MNYEMAMMMNWLLVAAGLLASDLFSDFFDSDPVVEDDVVEEEVEPLGDNLGLGPGDDTSIGTDQDDIILGQAGNDSISGGLGDDMLEGNTGDDSLAGGLGDDILAGGGDTDLIFGGDGDDILSSDRLNDTAEWTRGEDEILDGGAGDDYLYFADGDMVTGGEESDTFGMIQTGEGAAQITDFTPAEDDVLVYVEGLDEAATAPVLSYSNDTDADTTTFSLDGEATLVFAGQFTPEDLAVTLADLDTIDFAGVA